MRTLTVADVATRAGVSLRTAHRVISGTPRSEASRVRVEAAMADLGFEPHQKRPSRTFTCAVGDCNRQGPTRICGMHRERMRRTGTYADPATSLEEALWKQVEQSEDCWRWTGAINQQGYGVFFFDNDRWYAHRFVYELLAGSIPEDLNVDHVCHSRDIGCVEGPQCPHRRCVNPAHLEPVTPATNATRAAARRLACRRGHPWVASNIYIRPSGKRVCRACIAFRNDRARRARSASA